MLVTLGVDVNEDVVDGEGVRVREDVAVPVPVDVPLGVDVWDGHEVLVMLAVPDTEGVFDGVAPDESDDVGVFDKELDILLVDDGVREDVDVGVSVGELEHVSLLDDVAVVEGVPDALCVVDGVSLLV